MNSSSVCLKSSAYIFAGCCPNHFKTAIRLSRFQALYGSRGYFFLRTRYRLSLIGLRIGTQNINSTLYPATKDCEPSICKHRADYLFRKKISPGPRKNFQKAQFGFGATARLGRILVLYITNLSV
jgi:hypothetical protein